MEYRGKDWKNPYKGISAWSPEKIGRSKQYLIDNVYEEGASAMGEHILSLLKEKAPSSVIIDILSGYECKR